MTRDVGMESCKVSKLDTVDGDLFRWRFCLCGPTVHCTQGWLESGPTINPHSWPKAETRLSSAEAKWIAWFDLTRLISSLITGPPASHSRLACQADELGLGIAFYRWGISLTWKP